MIRYLLASTVPGMKRPWSTDDEESGLEDRTFSIGKAPGTLDRVGASEPSSMGAPQAPQNRLAPETSAPQAGQRITAATLNCLSFDPRLTRCLGALWAPH